MYDVTVWLKISRMNPGCGWISVKLHCCHGAKYSLLDCWITVHIQDFFRIVLHTFAKTCPLR